jgi:tetratricopeptide (TPR) repeat protein
MFEKAQKLEPKNSETYFYQWRLIMDLNWDFPSAEAKLKKALQLKKDNFEYYYRLGNAYMHQEKNKEAKIVFLQWIKLNNKYEKLRLNLWNVYYDLWDRKNGFNAYQSGIKVCSEMCASFYYNLWIEFSNIDNEKAKNYYKKALEINPNHEEARSNYNSLK